MLSRRIYIIRRIYSTKQLRELLSSDYYSTNVATSRGVFYDAEEQMSEIWHFVIFWSCIYLYVYLFWWINQPKWCLDQHFLQVSILFLQLMDLSCRGHQFSWLFKLFPIVLYFDCFLFPKRSGFCLPVRKSWLQ